MQWMASPEFQNSKWANTDEGRFAHDRLSNMEWWDGLKYIIDKVQPVYKLLRFVDREKKPNLCEVVYQYQLCKHEMESFFGNNVSTWNEYRQILDRRIRDLYIETYVGAGNTYAYFKCTTYAFLTYAYLK
jgi:hypothetical protein